MRKLLNTRKKTIAIIFVLVFGLQIATPLQTRALSLGVPIASNTFPDNLMSTDWIQKWIINPAVRVVIRALLQATTQQIVGWIQGGGGKNVGYVKNLEAALRREADAAGGEFLKNLTQLNLCGNFGASLNLTLRTPGLRQRLECTVTDIVRNVEAHFTNFKQGGWPAFIRMSIEPQNNPTGAYLIALDAKIFAESSAKQRIEKAPGIQQGFLGFRVPVKKNCQSVATAESSAFAGGGQFLQRPANKKFAGVNELDSTIKPVANRELAAVGPQLAQLSPQIDDFSSITAPSQPEEFGGFINQNAFGDERGGRAEEIETAGESGPRQLNCTTEYETKTPGTLIADTLSKSTNSGIDFAINAKDFDEAIATIINALISKVITSTFAGDDDSSSGQGIFDPGVSNIRLSGLENTAIFITRINDAVSSADQVIVNNDNSLRENYQTLFQQRRDLQVIEAQLAATSDPDERASIQSSRAVKLDQIRSTEERITKLQKTKDDLVASKIDFLELRRLFLSTSDPNQLQRLASRIPQLGVKLAEIISLGAAGGTLSSSASVDLQTGTTQAIEGTVDSINSTLAVMNTVLDETIRLASTSPIQTQRVAAEAQRDVLRAEIISLTNARTSLIFLRQELVSSTRETTTNRLIESAGPPLVDANQRIQRAMNATKFAVQAIR